MKRNFLLSLFCCLSILLIATGCDKNVQILKTESDVYSYLEEHFPNETFKIVEVEEIDNIADDACGETAKGNRWTVYSETTQTTFEVYDTYHFNSFTCEYSTNNNYKK